MKMSLWLLTAAVQTSLLMPTMAMAVDPLEADASHHRLEFQNNCVRVIRGFFGPGERSDGLFDAKAVVVIALTPSKSSRLLLPDGKYIDLPSRNSGDTWWAPAGRIGVENTSDSRVEFLVVEPQTGCIN